MWSMDANASTWGRLKHRTLPSHFSISGSIGVGLSLGGALEVMINCKLTVRGSRLTDHIRPQHFLSRSIVCHSMKMNVNKQIMLPWEWG